MTETSAQRSKDHPLQSERGTTTIQDAVVVSIANVAAGEVDGVHLSHGGTRLPGDTSPTVGEFLDNVTGSSGRVRGISVEVGERQVAVDLTVNMTYGKPVARTAETVRQNVIRRIEGLTGMEVAEVNITVNDVTFPSE